VPAFAHRFGLNGSIRGLNGFAESPSAGQLLRQPFEGMHAQCTHALPFQEHPVVVPARQQFRVESGSRYDKNVGVAERIEDTSGPTVELPNVHGYTTHEL